MLRDGLISTEWSSNLAYVIGLIASDGCLYNDGRHIGITSKDEEILLYIKEILNLRNKIGKKARGGGFEKKYFVLQFGSVAFYKFLLSIGLTSAKSKTMPKLNIPIKYFAPFLRGCVDGDGSIGTFIHPESKHPQLRLSLCSASIPFLDWIKDEIRNSFLATGGWIDASDINRCSILRYGIADSIIILNKLYCDGSEYFLRRKYRIWEEYKAGVA